MPFHFCTDELFVLLASIPVIGYFWRRFICVSTRAHTRIFGDGHKHDHNHKL